MVHRGASFREAGAGVSVVCIHASASSSGQWRPLMERLAGRFRSLAVDLYVRPARLRSLILFEPVLFAVLMAEDPRQPAAREIAAVRDDTVAAVDRGDLDTAGVRFVDYWMGAGTWAGMPVPRRQAVASAMSKVKAEWLAVFTEPTPLSAFAALDVPTLCIVGSKSPASSRGVARLLAKTLPSVTTVEIDGVGHMAPVTHPDRVNTVIASYLERVTATG